MIPPGDGFKHRLHLHCFSYLVTSGVAGRLGQKLGMKMQSSFHPRLLTLTFLISFLATGKGEASSKSESIRSERGIPGPVPAVVRIGCHDENGKFYALGEEISRGEDKDNNWCYGRFCGDDGSIIAWDNFECYPTTTTTEGP